MIKSTVKISFVNKLFINMPGRPKLTRHGFIFLTVFSALTLIVTIAHLPLFKKFTVIQQNTGEILYFCNIKPGDSFTITYQHSVNKSPVDEIFIIQKDGSIMLEKTVFRAFGAGIPFEVQPGQTFHRYPDRIEIGEINLKIPQFLLFVGVIANHRLTIHGRVIPLNRLTQPQQTVRFQVKRLSLITLLRRDRFGFDRGN